MKITDLHFGDLVFVQITKCSNPVYWYNKRIGEFFDVYVSSRYEPINANDTNYQTRGFYTLVETNESGCTKSIDFGDCVIEVKRRRKLEKIKDKIQKL